MSSSSSQHDQQIIKPLIRNVVSHSYLGHTFNLSLVAIAMNGRYNPRLFPACITHDKQTHTAISLFKSGKMVIVGARDETTAQYSSYRFAMTIRKRLNIPVGVYNFRVDNVVGSFNLRFCINLDLFLADHNLSAQWDPELFLGLSYKPFGTTKGAFSYVLFKTGKGIITGGRSVDVMNSVFPKHLADFRQYEIGVEYREQEESTKRLRECEATKKQPKKKKLKLVAAAAVPNVVDV